MRNQTASVRAEHLSDDAVREQLERILSSDEFILPERGRRFLRFIVDETLLGRQERLKAFTIAQDVFGRGAEFDAQNDPCVRISARQLRAALERYYLLAGSTDRILITIPSGGYVPSFVSPHAVQFNGSGQETMGCQDASNSAIMDGSEAKSPRREDRLIRWIFAGALSVVIAAVIFSMVAERENPALMTPVTIERPTIFVKSFTTGGQNKVPEDVLSGVTSEIVVQLANYKEIVVLTGKSAPDADNGPRAAYVIEGSIRRVGDDMRAVARLVRTDDNVVVWAANYDVDLKGRSMLDVELATARSIAQAVAAPFEKRP